MDTCKNVEHENPCPKDEYCGRCGISTCSPNFAYHVCIEKTVMSKHEILKFRDKVLHFMRYSTDDDALRFMGGVFFGISTILGGHDKDVEYHEIEKANKLNKEKRIQDD